MSERTLKKSVKLGLSKQDKLNIKNNILQEIKSAPDYPNKQYIDKTLEENAVSKVLDQTISGIKTFAGAVNFDNLMYTNYGEFRFGDHIKFTDNSINHNSLLEIWNNDIIANKTLTAKSNVNVDGILFAGGQELRFGGDFLNITDNTDAHNVLLHVNKDYINAERIVTLKRGANVDVYPTEPQHAVRKDYVDNKINESITRIYEYKGTVNTQNDLPTENLKSGYVYKVASTGESFVWDGSTWNTLDKDSYSKLETDTKLADLKAELNESISTTASALEEAIESSCDALRDETNDSILNVRKEVNQNKEDISELKEHKETTKYFLGDLYASDLHIQDLKDDVTYSFSDGTTISLWFYTDSDGIKRLEEIQAKYGIYDYLYVWDKNFLSHLYDDNLLISTFIDQVYYATRYPEECGLSNQFEIYSGSSMGKIITNETLSQSISALHNDQPRIVSINNFSFIQKIWLDHNKHLHIEGKIFYSENDDAKEDNYILVLPLWKLMQDAYDNEDDMYSHATIHEVLSKASIIIEDAYYYLIYERNFDYDNEDERCKQVTFTDINFDIRPSNANSVLNVTLYSELHNLFTGMEYNVSGMYGDVPYSGKIIRHSYERDDRDTNRVEISFDGWFGNDLLYVKVKCHRGDTVEDIFEYIANPSIDTQRYRKVAKSKKTNRLSVHRTEDYDACICCKSGFVELNQFIITPMRKVGKKKKSITCSSGYPLYATEKVWFNKDVLKNLFRSNEVYNDLETVQAPCHSDQEITEVVKLIDCLEDSDISLGAINRSELKDFFGSHLHKGKKLGHKIEFSDGITEEFYSHISQTDNIKSLLYDLKQALSSLYSHLGSYEFSKPATHLFSKNMFVIMHKLDFNVIADGAHIEEVYDETKDKYWQRWFGNLLDEYISSYVYLFGNTSTRRLLMFVQFPTVKRRK